MPYYTHIPGATINLDLETPVISLGNNLLLNQLYTSTEFSQYDVDATSATTLQRGDELSLVDEDGNPLLAGGTYAGQGTLSTAAVNAGIPTLASLTIQLNPISGSYVAGDDGRVYFVTDQPLSEDHIGVKITGTILGLPINLADVNISDLADVLPGGSQVLSLVQGVLDTIVVNVAYDPDGELELTDDDVFPCFTAGTLIDTPHGQVPVETLRVGDLVLTVDHGPQPVRWIGRRRFSAAQLAANPHLTPIRIRAGALAADTPATDLVVSPQHRILVRSAIAQRMFCTNEILAAAKQLVLIPGVDEARDMTEVEYVHILFDQHEVVRANGTATESLYLGPEAIKSLPRSAVQEILTIFPDLAEHAPDGARPLVPGRQARKLAQRHAQHRKPLIAALA